MASDAPPAGNTPPPKPWQRSAAPAGPAPFKPPSSGSTGAVVEASGTAKPGESVSTVAAGNINATSNVNTLSRPVPPRPWQQGTYGGSYGGYGSNMYSSYGGFGGYGGGMYGGNSLYSNYGGLYGGSGMYGGGMYNNGFGGSYGGYGMGMGAGGPYGANQDPNNPYGPPSSPPGFWISFLQAMGNVVSFFGRIAMLIDQNTQAFHMFMTALLQLFDRSGLLYGELARFVLRLLGIRARSRKPNVGAPDGVPSLEGQGPQLQLEAPKAAGNWDNVWGGN